MSTPNYKESQVAGTITLALDINEVNVVLAGLGKLPLEVSLGTFTTVKQQAEEQATQIQKQEPPAPKGDGK